jgi:hypothetical protein
MNKEPALIGLVALWIVNRLIDVANVATPINPEALEGMVELVTALLVAVFIRAKVFSKSTIEEAGLNPEKIERDAKNPNVMRFRS